MVKAKKMYYCKNSFDLVDLKKSLREPHRFLALRTTAQTPPPDLLRDAFPRLVGCPQSAHAFNYSLTLLSSITPLENARCSCRNPDPPLARRWVEFHPGGRAEVREVAQECQQQRKAFLLPALAFLIRTLLCLSIVFIVSSLVKGSV